MDYDEGISPREFAVMAIREINQKVERQLRIDKDEEGYAFLTNARKGEPAPFEFAKEYGFIQAVFKVKEAKLPVIDAFQFGHGAPDEIVKENREWLLKTDESWWVKEGVNKDERQT